MPNRRSTAYRYPGEQIILLLTLSTVFLVAYYFAKMPFRTLLMFVALGVAATYFINRTRHQILVHSGKPVTIQTAPELAQLAKGCADRLQPGPLEIYIASEAALNAYAFGLSEPKVIVLYSALFDEMDEDEIRFILGHEMGHICLDHTWLNSLVGGLAGVPSTYLVSTLFRAAFLWWNRACEYSADRAGLLACDNLAKALSALVKLEAGPGKVRSSVEFQRVLELIQKEDQDFRNGLNELLATHPITIHRITALREYASSSGYSRLKAQLNRASQQTH